MQKVSDIVVTEDFRCLVYGVSGTGKTIFAAGFPEPIIFIQCDPEGTLSIKTSKIISEEKKEHIHFEPIEETFYKEGVTGRAIPTAYNKVKDVFEVLIKTGEFKGVKPKTVVLDGLTLLSEFALSEVLAKKNRLDTDKVTQPEWGQQIRNIANVISQGVALKDVYFICTAHEQFQKDQNSGRIWCLPATTGKFASRIALYFSEYYRAEVEETVSGPKYKLKTRPSGLITARTRLDLPPEIETSFQAIKSYFNTRQKEQKEVQNVNTNLGISK